MALKVAELESIFTGNLTPFEQAASKVESRQKALHGKKAELVLVADGSTAMRTIDQVSASARGLPDSELIVTADTARAESALDDLESDAKSAGEDAGDKAGSGLAGGIVAALVSIPIAGAVVGIGAAFAKAAGDGIIEGLQNEVRSDRLQAATGLDPVTVGRLAKAAGEVYADNWGESIQANMSTIEIAVQSDLLSPKSTQREAERLLSNIAGVAELVGGEANQIIRSVATLIRNGLAKDADEAFDIIIKGQQSSLDLSEDWLDTINEYSTFWRTLGLTAPQAIGLLQQAVKAGARDTDKAADALKEFSILAVDGSDRTKDAFKALGLNAGDMGDRVAKGGKTAADALGVVFDALRKVSDPELKKQLAVALFGSPGEDLADALFSMDLSKVEEKFSSIRGIASEALTTMTDNDADALESAKRNIELAADGIKGALATAFSPQIEGFADYVQSNRTGVVEFLLTVANGALDMGIAFVEGTAVATEAVGDFIAGPLADLVDAIADVLDGMDWAGFGVTQEAANEMRGYADSMRGADEKTQEVADSIRKHLIEGVLDPAKEKLNSLGEGIRAEAFYHDTGTRVAQGIEAIAEAAEGTDTKVGLVKGALDLTTESGRLLDEQLKNVRDSMYEQGFAAQDAGASQEDLTQRLDEGRDALIETLTQMGLNKKEAEALLEQYNLLDTKEIVTVVTADTSDVLAAIKVITGTTWTTTIKPQFTPYYPAGLAPNAKGNIIQPMAMGGLVGTAMAPLAQMVPPGTLRVVGDRLDVDEAYIPLDGSPRSVSLLWEAFRRMPGLTGMAAGGFTGRSPTVIPQSVSHHTEQPIYVDKFYGSVSDLEDEMEQRRAKAAWGGNY